MHLLLLPALLLSASAVAAETPCPEAARPLLPEGPQPLPERVMLLGSSSIEWGFGPALEAELDQLGVAETVREGRMSTGLSRPDFFDWVAHARQLAETHHPDLVLVQLGGNDAQHLRDPRGRRVADWGTEAWDATYRQRLLDLVAAVDAPVILVGTPHPELSEYAARMCHVNRLLRDTAEHSRAWFLPLWDLTTAPDGTPLTRFEAEGRSHLVRRDDGIHLGKWGAPWAAAAVVATLSKRLDLLATCVPEGEACETEPAPAGGSPG